MMLKALEDCQEYEVRTALFIRFSDLYTLQNYDATGEAIRGNVVFQVVNTFSGRLEGFCIFGKRSLASTLESIAFRMNCKQKGHGK